MLLIIPVTVPLIQNLGVEIQRAKNMHKARSVVYFCIAIANVAISIPLIRMLGPSGAALGTGISLTVGNIFFMNWYYHNRIGLNMLYYWKNIAKFIPALILPILVGIAMNMFISMDSFLILCVCIVIYAAVYCFSMWIWGMNSYERQIITESINKIQRRN